MVIQTTKAIPTLAVADIEKARNFYGKVLEFEEEQVEEPGEDAVVYKVGDDYLYLYKRPDAAGSTSTTVAFPVKDLETTVKALRDKGVAFEEYDIPEMGLKTENGIARMGTTQTAWFKDPSGNILAIEHSGSNYLQ